MDSQTKPLYLLADSQLLFLGQDQSRFLQPVRASLDTPQPKAAYVGASNGDNPDFYALFVAAMEGLGIGDCRMIRASFSKEDAGFVERADLILLAGGDVRRGWNTLRQNGLAEILRRRYFEGALLMGVSAGAVQLGLFGWTEEDAAPRELFETLQLVPFVVSAHDEQQGWMALRAALRLAGEGARGLGIPTGGGLMYHPERRLLTPLRYPPYEFVHTAGQVIAAPMGRDGNDRRVR